MKSLAVHYDSSIQHLNLKTTFQVNKIAKYLANPDIHESLAFDLGPYDKVAVKLEGVVAVETLYPDSDYSQAYTLQLAFSGGKEFRFPIWGEKRARNAYYLFEEKLRNKSQDNNYYRILQNNNKEYSLVKLYQELQLVKLHQPEAQQEGIVLNESTTSTVQP
jgi:hypothetical protein